MNPGMTIKEYDDFLTMRGYARSSSEVWWQKHLDLTGHNSKPGYGVQKLNLKFEFTTGQPNLEVLYMGPRGEYDETEERYSGRVYLPINRDEFFGTFDLKEEALVKSAVSLLAHVYGSTVSA